MEHGAQTNPGSVHWGNLTSFVSPQRLKTHILEVDPWRHPLPLSLLMWCKRGLDVILFRLCLLLFSQGHFVHALRSLWTRPFSIKWLSSLTRFCNLASTRFQMALIVLHVPKYAEGTVLPLRSRLHPQDVENATLLAQKTTSLPTKD